MTFSPTTCLSQQNVPNTLHTSIDSSPKQTKPFANIYQSQQNDETFPCMKNEMYLNTEIRTITTTAHISKKLLVLNIRIKEIMLHSNLKPENMVLTYHLKL